MESTMKAPDLSSPSISAKNCSLTAIMHPKSHIDLNCDIIAGCEHYCLAEANHWVDMVGT